MATSRHKQFAPTAECLEIVYDEIKATDQRIFDAQLVSDDAEALARAIRHLGVAVSLLADVVDRHITAPELEERYGT